MLHDHKSNEIDKEEEEGADGVKKEENGSDKGCVHSGENQLYVEETQVTKERRKGQLERALGNASVWISQHAKVVLLTLVLAQITLVGIQMGIYAGVPMQTRVEKLWVESGGRLEEETEYVESHKTDGWEKGYNYIIFTTKDYFQSSADAPLNVLTKGMLQDHLKVMQRVLNITVPFRDNIEFSLSGAIPLGDGSSIATVYNLCDYAPFPLALVPDNLKPLAGPLLATYTPCNRVTVLDCFREGSLDFLDEEMLQYLTENIPEIAELGIEGYSSLPSFETMTDEEIFQAAQHGCRGYIRPLMEWDIRTLFGGIKVNQSDPGTIQSLRAFQYIIPLASPKQLEEKLAAKGITAEEILSLQHEFSAKLEVAIEELNGELEFAEVFVFSFGSFERMLEEFSSANSLLIFLGYGLMALFVAASQFSSTPVANLMSVGIAGLLLVFLGNLFALSLLVLMGVKMNATIMQVLPFLALGLGVDDLFVLLSVFRELVVSVSAESHDERVLRSLLETAGVSVTLTSLCNACAFAVGVLIPLPAVQVFSVAACTAVIVNYVSLIVALPALLSFKLAKRLDRPVHVHPATCGGCGSCSCEPTGPSLHPGREANSKARSKFLEAYIECVVRPIPRFLGVVFLIALVGVSGWLSTQVEDGLEIVDVVPSESTIYRAVDVLSSEFKLSPSQIVFTELDYGDPAVQKAMIDLMEDLNNLSFVEDAEASWVKRVTEHFVGEGNYIDAKGPSFRKYMAAFVNSSSLTYLTSYTEGMFSFGYSPQGDLTYTTCDFKVVEQDSTAEYIAVLEEVRAFLDQRCGPDQVLKECFPSGTIFTFWEQYVTLRSNFWLAVVYSTSAVFAACVLLLRSLWAGLFIAAFSCAVVVQIFGALFVLGIKFSAIPAVSLIMAVGLSVEFTVHICIRFLQSRGLRRERVQQSLRHMLIPVLEGGVSSFLGFVCLAFSPFAFVQRYYFGIYCTVVLLGLVNGLYFLPSCLGILGPGQHS